MKKLLMSVAVFMAACAVAPAQQSDAVARWAALTALNSAVYPNIVYKVANNYECKLDVILPADHAKLLPVFVYYHGGGWISGDKEEVVLYNLPFLAQGMAVVNVEYRLAKVSLAPAAVEDARSALHWVFTHAKKYGFDLDRVVVSGGSAGGHLCLMAGMLMPEAGFDNDAAEREPVNLKVAAIVNSRGPTDLAAMLDQPSPPWFLLNWFGSQSNPRELAKRLSPITYVRPGLPPVFTMHGDADEYVSYTQQAVRLHEALTRAGVPNQLHTMHGGHHNGFTPEQIIAMHQAAIDFLKQYGILPR